MEKKWLREGTSHAYPFELTFPGKRPSHGHGVDGLSSIFIDKTSHSTSKELSMQDMRKEAWDSFSGSSDAKCPKDTAELRVWFSKFHNRSVNISSMDYGENYERELSRKLDCLRYGYFTMDNLVAACTSNPQNDLKNNKCPKKSRKDIISDCRNLLKDFLQYNPYGFNIGLFAPMFLKRYGYVLDYKMLGYSKLVSLLQIMPGVKIEPFHVLPAVVVHPDSTRQKGVPEELHNYSLETGKRMMNGLDSEDLIDENNHPWEELGPKSTNGKSNQEVRENLEFSELFILDEELSDPQQSEIASDRSQKQASGRNNDWDALLEVLDRYSVRPVAKEDGKRENLQGAKEGNEEDQMQGATEAMRSQLQITKEGSNVDRMQTAKEGRGGTDRTQTADGLINSSEKKDSSSEKHKLFGSKEESQSINSLLYNVRKSQDAKF